MILTVNRRARPIVFAIMAAGAAVAIFVAGYRMGRNAPVGEHSTGVGESPPSPVPAATTVPAEVVAEASLGEIEESSSADDQTKTAKADDTLAAARQLWIEANGLPPGPERNERMIDALRAISRHDCALALDEAQAIPEVKLRSDALEAVFVSAGENRPEEAWKVMASLPNDGSLPGERVELFLHGLSRGDARQALEFLSAHREEIVSHRGSIEGTLDRIYENGGHDVLRSWIDGQPEGKARDAATNRFIDQWARYDPEGAKAWMDSQTIPAGNLPAARVELAESWARVHPDDAVEWVRSLPPNEQSRELYDAVFRRWIQYDRNKAAEWLAAQPPSPVLDSPIERYTREVMEYDPANTMTWAESITDGDRRFRMMREVAERWGRADPQALTNFVASRDLPPAQKQRLLRTVQARRQ